MCGVEARVVLGEHSYLKVGGGGEDTEKPEKKQRWWWEPECRGWKVEGRKPAWITFKKPG